MNSIDRRIQSISFYCKTVTELWNLLTFIYDKSDNLNHIYTLLQEIFQPHVGQLKFMDYFFLEFKQYI